MCCWDVWGEVFFKQLFDGLRSYLNFLDKCVDCLIQMRNSNCQNLSFLTHLHTRLYLYKKKILLFSKYIFMFILEPNQLPHLWWCEEKPLLDRNVSTYIVNRTRTAVGYKTVRRTSKSSNWYCLTSMVFKKLLKLLTMPKYDCFWRKTFEFLTNLFSSFFKEINCIFFRFR